MTKPAGSEEIVAARAAAAEAPGDVRAQMRAAYACDRFGDESEAVGYYDAAWKLGVPASERRRFLVGYGSTLRNVGRSEEAIALLRDAVDEFPDFAPLSAFLALALHRCGHHRGAMAAALDAVLAAAGDSDSLDGYDRALREYRDELRGPPGAPQRIAPVLPVRDVNAALALYARLGFRTSAYNEDDGRGPVYGFGCWGDVEVHFARVPEIDPARTTSACYLWVEDADALHARWAAEGLPGRLHPPEDTEYALRELAYVDPDGNLLRVGSPLD
jgi:catechol 2,3-dioxygenase-like lactoylglutathione lyase family enzyme